MRKVVLPSTVVAHPCSASGSVKTVAVAAFRPPLLLTPRRRSGSRVTPLEPNVSATEATNFMANGSRTSMMDTPSARRPMSTVCATGSKVRKSQS